MAAEQVVESKPWEYKRVAMLKASEVDIRVYEQASELALKNGDNDASNLLIRLASLQTKRGLTEQAVANASKAIEVDSLTGEHPIFFSDDLIDSLLKLHRYDEVEKLLKQAAAKAKEVTKYRTRGYGYSAQLFLLFYFYVLRRDNDNALQICSELFDTTTLWQDRLITEVRDTKTPHDVSNLLRALRNLSLSIALKTSLSSEFKPVPLFEQVFEFPAKFQQSTEDTKLAESLLLKILAAEERVFAPYDSRLISTFSCLADVQNLAGKKIEAAANYEEALEIIQRKSHEPDMYKSMEDRCLSMLQTMDDRALEAHIQKLVEKINLNAQQASEQKSVALNRRIPRASQNARLDMQCVVFAGAFELCKEKKFDQACTLLRDRLTKLAKSTSEFDRGQRVDTQIKLSEVLLEFGRFSHDKTKFSQSQELFDGAIKQVHDPDAVLRQKVRRHIALSMPAIFELNLDGRIEYVEPGEGSQFPGILDGKYDVFIKAARNISLSSDSKGLTLILSGKTVEDLAQKYMDEGNFRQAYNCLLAGIRIGLRVTTFNRLAEYWYFQNDFSRAVQACDAALEFDKSDQEMLNLRALISNTDVEQKKQNERLTEAPKTALGSGITVSSAESVNDDLAQIFLLMSSSKFREAIALENSLLKRNPHVWRLLCLRAQCFTKLNEKASAEADLEAMKVIESRAAVSDVSS